LLDLLNWELDQHTGDLRDSLVADEVLDEWEDGFTNSLLKVWVLLGDLGGDLHGNLLVLSGHWVRWSSLGTWLRHWSTHWGSWLWRHHTTGWLRHWCSHWGSWSWHTTSHVWHWLSIWHHTSRSWLVHLSTWTSLAVSSWSTLVLSWTSLTVSSWATWTSSLIVVEVSVHLLVLLHDIQQLLENLGHVRVAGKIVKMESTGFLGLILLEISLIDGIFDLDLSLLLDLVVVDDQGLSLESSVVKVGLGNSS